MRTTTLQRAMRLVGRGSTIVSSGGCGTPETLLAHLGARAAEVGDVTLCSGVQLGEYPFLDAVSAGDLRYRTWHLVRPLRRAFAAGEVEYVPARASEVPALLLASRPDVALVRVTPPDANGLCSLGPSVGYARPAATIARVTIAEVDDDLPWTHGDSTLHVRDIDALVPTECGTCEYRAAPASALARDVAAHVAGLLPRDPTIQMGIGAVPEALSAALPDLDLGRIRFVGMGTDAMVDAFERGVVDTSATVPGLTSPELMGTQRLLRFAHDNPVIGMFPSTRSHDPALVGRADRLVSINSAICVDLSGQACSEKPDIGATGAVGGSFDYAEAAYASEGGIRVIALPSTAASGTVTRIVPSLDATRSVTIPRHSVDAVVTEHGIAWLRGRSIDERAVALIAIADPRHRDELAAAAGAERSRIARPPAPCGEDAS